MSLGNFTEASREHIFSVPLFLNDFITFHQYITYCVKRQALYSTLSFHTYSFNAILAAVGEDIVFYVFLCLVNSKVSFTKDICIEVE